MKTMKSITRSMLIKIAERKGMNTDELILQIVRIHPELEIINDVKNTWK
jgi:hypothetical protein